MLRAVIFDMDDTLIDWSQREGGWPIQKHLQPIYEYLLAAGYVLPPLDWVAGIYHQQAQAAWARAVPPDWDAPRQIDILRETLIALELDIQALDIEYLQRLFAWDVVPGVRVFEDAETVLRTIRAAGLRTGLLTNTSLPIWMRDAELRAFGLLEYLEVRITAGDVGKIKPHPRPFHFVAERLGVQPEEAVYVGDRLYDDVVGALAAGMRAVWVRRSRYEGEGEIRPHATIDSLTDLLRVLDEWHPGWRENHNDT
ncbi:MAG TPA: HAD family hydrolase [Chloroflexi bacterium]|nr:HAD family hydrolase [Chloroflexota bacterium]